MIVCEGLRKGVVRMNLSHGEWGSIPGPAWEFMVTPPGGPTERVTLLLLKTTGIGRRWLFEVEAPDDMKITIDRWWTPKERQ